MNTNGNTTNLNVIVEAKGAISGTAKDSIRNGKLLNAATMAVAVTCEMRGLNRKTVVDTLAKALDKACGGSVQAQANLLAAAEAMLDAADVDAPPVEVEAPVVVEATEVLPVVVEVAPELATLPHLTVKMTVANLGATMRDMADEPVRDRIAALEAVALDEATRYGSTRSGVQKALDGWRRALQAEDAATHPVDAVQAAPADECKLRGSQICDPERPCVGCPTPDATDITSVAVEPTKTAEAEAYEQAVQQARDDAAKAKPKAAPVTMAANATSKVQRVSSAMQAVFDFFDAAFCCVLDGATTDGATVRIPWHTLQQQPFSVTTRTNVGDWQRKQAHFGWLAAKAMDCKGLDGRLVLDDALYLTVQADTEQRLLDMLATCDKCDVIAIPEPKRAKADKATGTTTVDALRAKVAKLSAQLDAAKADLATAELAVGSDQ